MKKLYRYISQSWPVFVVLILAVPLLAYTAVSWYEKHYGNLPYLGINYEWYGNENNAIAVAPFRFTDQGGNEFRSDRGLKNKIAVVHFFFTSCPVICPSMIRRVKTIADWYRADKGVVFLSLTVDPERDTPEKLHAYASRYGIDSTQWKLLTGDKKALYYLARKGFYITATDGDGGPDDFIHSDRLVLMDKQHYIRGYYKGVSDKEVQLLINDIKKLENE